MSTFLKARPTTRVRLETLEDRLAPAITLLSGSFNVGGSINATVTTTTPNISIFQQATPGQYRITDQATDTMGLLVNGVFGNITINASRSGVGPITGIFSGEGTTNGNVSIRLTGSGATGTATFDLLTDATSSILGNLSVTTVTGANATTNLNPDETFTVGGNVSVTNTNGLAASTKVVNLGATGETLNVNGSFSAPSVTSLVVNGTTTVGGALTVSTRATATPTVTLTDAAAITLGSLSVTMATPTGAGGSVTVGTTTVVNSFVNINLGAGPNTVDFNTGATVLGSSIVIQAGNGNQTIDIGDIVAGNAKLFVSLGNGTNTVDFDGAGGASLLSATLVGGTGTNTVSGIINFPLYLFRFGF